MDKDANYMTFITPMEIIKIYKSHDGFCTESSEYKSNKLIPTFNIARKRIVKPLNRILNDHNFPIRWYILSIRPQFITHLRLLNSSLYKRQQNSFLVTKPIIRIKSPILEIFFWIPCFFDLWPLGTSHASFARDGNVMGPFIAGFELGRAE